MSEIQIVFITFLDFKAKWDDLVPPQNLQLSFFEISIILIYLINFQLVQVPFNHIKLQFLLVLIFIMLPHQLCFFQPLLIFINHHLFLKVNQITVFKIYHIPFKEIFLIIFMRIIESHFNLTNLLKIFLLVILIKLEIVDLLSCLFSKFSDKIFLIQILLPPIINSDGVIILNHLLIWKAATYHDAAVLAAIYAQIKYFLLETVFHLSII